jgi:hypothetical protein
MSEKNKYSRLNLLIASSIILKNLSNLAGKISELKKSKTSNIFK